MTGASDRFEDDPLSRLRGYRTLAPWNVRELAALVGALLDVTAVYPLNAAASARPSERTIRFYVSRGLVTPPEGKGTAAIYVYRHLLQVLTIKLRQREGATLDTIRTELVDLGGDVIERRVAAALGSRLPRPDDLGWSRLGRGRSHLATGSPSGQTLPEVAPTMVRRIPIAPGCELLISEGHPLWRRGEDRRVADLVRRALADAEG